VTPQEFRDNLEQAEGRVIYGNFPKRSADPLAEDWTAQAGTSSSGCRQLGNEPIPDFNRHTIDIDRQPMSVEDEPREISVGWQRFGLLIMLVSGGGMGYAWSHWVLPHLLDWFGQ
jgi:hypothetical protein